MHQRTLNSDLCFCGFGYKTGKSVTVKIQPASKDTGIVFVRTDISDRNNVIPALYINATKNDDGITAIANSENVQISGIENVLAALWAAKITNVIINVDGPEMPLTDGSSEHFLFGLRCITTVLQDSLLLRLKILRSIFVNLNNEDHIIAEPDEHLIVNCSTKSHSKKKHNVQKFEFDSKKMNFLKEISRSRLFLFREKSAYSQNDANEDKSGNNHSMRIRDIEPYRYHDEDVRSMISCCIGDLMLCGSYKICGKFYFKDSHNFNNIKIMQNIFIDSNNYTIIEEE